MEQPEEKYVIYSPWAFTEDEKMKSNSNYKIFKELSKKYSTYVFTPPYGPVEEDMKKDVVAQEKHCYGHNEYKIIKKPDELTMLDIALILDGGNLCFGHYIKGETIGIFND